MGHVSDGLVDINRAGKGDQYNMTEPPVSDQLDNGVFWKKILSWHQQGHLLGADTPPHPQGDSAVINGIVQGHAYSVLDVREVHAMLMPGLTLTLTRILFLIQLQALDFTEAGVA